MPKVLSPSDKFQLRNVGELMHPGICMSCGSGTCQEGYVDLASYFDYEGQMYLCSFCLQEAAEVLGCLTIAESKQLQAMNENLVMVNTQMSEELANANERLAAFDTALRPLVEPTRMGGNLDQEAHVRNLTLVNETPGIGESGEPEAEESVTEPGRNDAEQHELRNGLDL